MAKQYQPKVYKENGGDRLTVESGGEVNMIAGGKVLDDGVQASAITDETGTADGTYSANEQTMLNNLKTKVNSLILGSIVLSAKISAIKLTARSVYFQAAQ